MFDVFYFGPKPNLFEFEKPADNLEHAAKLCRTGFYWFIYGGNDYAGFDFDYQPVPWEANHIHVWPSQWQKDAGVYLAHVDSVKDYVWHYRNEQHVNRLPSMDHWSIPEEVDPQYVDFSWHPDPTDPPYIYHFGTEYQPSVGLTYTVPGATELKFAGLIPGTENALEVLDIFFVDRNNATAQTRYERLKNKYPRIQKVRYANSIMDTIKRCVTRSSTGKFWVISSEYNYENFDFAWHAEPWQSYMTHVFPSQHQKWSDTFLINKYEFEKHSQWATSLEQFPNLNFVSSQQVEKPDTLMNIFYVDHSNGKIAQHQYDYLKTKYPDIVKTRFVDNYLDTFKRIMSVAETEYVWIINSICDYTQFDFTWEPEPWQKEMIHVFPSGYQARGDTFYIHVESFKKQMVELELLDWFNVINYCDDQQVQRFSMPVHYYNTDNLVQEIKNYTFTGPYALFTNQKGTEFQSSICLWTEKDRVVDRCSVSGATAIVPRDIKSYLKTQIYDYPYLETSIFQVNEHYNDDNTGSLDIVFVSNGEPGAAKRFEHLKYATFFGKGFTERTSIKEVTGVNGQVAALKEAARLSTTPWFFMVPGKLKVDSNFNWGWMPDYYQEPKHYIFHAHNPVNGLEYGHMAMIAYNKKLIETMSQDELDSSLSQQHEVVPVLSGIAEFNTDPWTAWRTAFREVLKLQYYADTECNIENEHRLNVWQTKATGHNAEWVLRGAQDALAYYREINGDYKKISLSRNWNWLRDRFDSKYA